jgi:hypothetical protein
MGNLIASQGRSVFRCSKFYGTPGIKHDDRKRFQFEIASMRNRFGNDGLRD